MPTKNVVRVSWTCVAVADRSPATRGNAGTYMSVASGAIAVRKTTVAISPEVSATWRRATGSTGLDVKRGTRQAHPHPGPRGSHRRWVHQQYLPEAARGLREVRRSLGVRLPGLAETLLVADVSGLPSMRPG